VSFRTLLWKILRWVRRRLSGAALHGGGDMELVTIPFGYEGLSPSQQAKTVPICIKAKNEHGRPIDWGWFEAAACKASLASARSRADSSYGRYRGRARPFPVLFFSDWRLNLNRADVFICQIVSTTHL